jgi:hypothetical protein
MIGSYVSFGKTWSGRKRTWPTQRDKAAMASPPSRLGCEGVRGERHPLAKLNEDIVKFIRRSGEGTVSLAKRFRVAHGTITKARKKVSWAWVESE